MAYCTQEDVLIAAGNWTDPTTEDSNRITDSIAKAGTLIETFMGQSFEQQNLQVTTQAIHRRQTRLFLPMPCISISSLTENGNALNQVSAGVGDFYLYQPTDSYGLPRGPGWLEKAVPVLGYGDMFAANPYFWSMQQMGVVIQGEFGYATPPPEIVKLAAWMAAMLLGKITQSYVDFDGMQKAVAKNAMPDWALDIKDSYVRSALDEQFYSIQVL